MIIDTTTQKPKEQSGDLGRGSEVQESQIHEGGRNWLRGQYPSLVMVQRNLGQEDANIIREMVRTRMKV